MDEITWKILYIENKGQEIISHDRFIFLKQIVYLE